jgi:hypothetical protein
VEPQSKGEERELRAGRNQALFRAVNEQLEALHDGSARQTIACECADVACTQIIEIDHEQYTTVRRNPRRFVVLPGHVYPEVESVVEERDGYVVVEKHRVAAKFVEAVDAARS